MLGKKRNVGTIVKVTADEGQALDSQEVAVSLLLKPLYLSGSSLSSLMKGTEEVPGSH